MVDVQGEEEPPRAAEPNSGSTLAEKGSRLLSGTVWTAGVRDLG